MYKIIIVGGMAAGCKAAARLSRISSDYEITIIERKSFISFGSCGLPLYASGDIDNVYELAKTGYGVIRDKDYFRDVKGITVLTNTEVEKLDTVSCEVTFKDLEKSEIHSLPYDALILATGAGPVKPQFSYSESPRISSFHTPKDAQDFRKEAQKGNIEKAVIIGGGFIGCELTEAMSSLWGIETTLIEIEGSLLSRMIDPEISRLIENRIRKNGVKILLSSKVKKIETNDQGLPLVYLKDGIEIKTDYVFYNLGIKPETTLAEDINIRLGKFGGIRVDEAMKTNIPKIWAAGDCVETTNLITGKPDYFPLGSLSNRMARVVADSIANKETYFRGAVGTASLKIFNCNVCATGLTEKKAIESGYDTGSVIGCWSDRPDYHPENKNIFGKLVYQKEGLKLLGLQLVGDGEVTRYIDTFSELLSNFSTAYDMVDLEHAYTPAHSSPISPLNYFGYMAINQEEDSVKNFNPLCISSFKGIFIDVREKTEMESVPFPGKAIHIPISQIRMRLKEFDLNQSILFICEKGPRAYEAARIFLNNGFKNVSYLGGGMIMQSEMNIEQNSNIANKDLSSVVI